MQRLANNFGAINASVPTFLNLVDFAHRLVGPKPLEYLSSVLNRATGNYIPEWNRYMPRVRQTRPSRVLRAAIFEQKTYTGCHIGRVTI